MQIVKLPKWLSPSSLKALEKCPNTFYLQRMAPDPWPYDKQSPPAAVGSSFDALVKLQLIETGVGSAEEIRDRVYADIYNPEDKARLKDADLRQIMLECNISPELKLEALTQGQIILDKYNFCRMNEKVKYVDLEIHKHWNLIQYTDMPVPLFMKLDAAVVGFTEDSDGAANVRVQRTVPLDWKVTGYGSEKGVSPKQGYMCLMDGGLNKGPHKIFTENIALDSIDEAWAMQICTYGWGLGIPVGLPFVGFIIQVCIRPTGMRFALFRGWVTHDFQMALVKRYVDGWRSLMDGSFMERVAPTRDLAEITMINSERWW